MRLHTNEERAEGTCREDAGAAVTLVCRRLSPAEARLLHEELKTTTNIFGYTVPELLRFREMIIAEADGVFAGACLSKDLLFDWTDIAALYVLPAHLHMNRHMMSRYRLREMRCKAKLRGSGGPALTAGMKRRNARSG